MISEEQRLYQLIYRSRSALTGSEASVDNEVNVVIDQSRRNNFRDGVTGALIFTASVFIQVLEGRSSDLERTFERICCDTRHAEVELMSFSTVVERRFENWNMHRVYANATIEALCRQLGNGATTQGGNTADVISKALALMASTAATRPACGDGGVHPTRSRQPVEMTSHQGHLTPIPLAFRDSLSADQKRS